VAKLDQAMEQVRPLTRFLPPKSPAPVQPFGLGEELLLTLRTQHAVGLEHDSTMTRAG